MSTTRLRGLTATGVAMGLIVGFGGLAHAASPVTLAKGARATAPQIVTVPTTDARCATTTPLTLFNINDFHGRILDAAKLFTPVEQLRATQKDVILASAGDNVGASIFESFINNDDPAIDILNTAGVAVSAPGNHEFDKGYADFKNHIEVRATFDYVAANMTGTDMAPYKVVTTTSGIRVAYIGANVADLPSLVSPAGIAGITVSPEVAAVNAVADQITAANAADIIVAEVHNDIRTGYNTNVDVVFNGHTHGSYAEVNANGIPVVQAASYGTKLGRVDLAIGTGNVICGTPVPSLVTPPATADLSYPVIAAIQKIADAAKASAAVVGAQVIGQACTNITRGSTPGVATSKPGDDRGVESTATDMVANAFFDIVGGNPDTTIGMQNPGGTRADIAAGEVTYAEAAAVLPFANTIMTTDITGAQLKKVLEQQWQRDKDGNVPSRAYLQLGLSDNVTYTYDETRPEGDRITGIWINGKAYDPAKLYTVASGSFLITGGDNFFELAKGTNTTDTGKADLDSFVNWVKTTKAGSLCPTYERQAVSLTASAATVQCTGSTTFGLGIPAATSVAKDTLNFSNGAPAETSVQAFAGTTSLGTFAVTNGQATVSLTAPAGGSGGALWFKTTNGTIIRTGASVATCAAATGTLPKLANTGVIGG